MLSIIITSKDEPKSIAKSINCILDTEYSGLNGDYELITVISGQKTIDAAKETMRKYPNVKWTSLIDEYKGKSYALNKAFKIAKGDFFLLTDGDVYINQGAVGFLQKRIASDEKIGGVTGRPRSLQDKKSMWGYYGNLLSDGAHHKRMITLNRAEGYSRLFIRKSTPFFPMSGYLSIIRNFDIEIKSLIDDVYISYVIYNKGYKIAYEPAAEVYVKFPTNLKDWINQKIRSAGGYIQIWKFGLITKETNARNFLKELEYFWFPVKYAKSLKELLWSLILYPLRLFMWIRIYWERKILNKDFAKTWMPIQSTK